MNILSESYSVSLYLLFSASIILLSSSPRVVLYSSLLLIFSSSPRLLFSSCPLILFAATPLIMFYYAHPLSYSLHISFVLNPFWVVKTTDLAVASRRYFLPPRAEVTVIR